MEQQRVTYGAQLSWIVVRISATAHSYQFCHISGRAIRNVISRTSSVRYIVAIPEIELVTDNGLIIDVIINSRCKVNFCCSTWSAVGDPVITRCSVVGSEIGVR